MYHNNTNKTGNIMMIIFYLFFVAAIIFVAYSFYIGIFTVYPYEKDVIVNKGDTYQMLLLPKNSKYYDLNNYIFESENNSIAQIDKYGVIKGINNGETRVSVRYKNSYSKEYVSVKIEDIEINSLEVDKKIEINKNTSEKVKVKVNNNKKVNTNLSYSSSDESVVKVDELGNITGVSEGSAKIIVESPNGIKDEVEVKVSAVKEKIENIKIKDSNKVLETGSNKKLELVTTPANVSTESVTWSSSDTSVAEVDSSGKITAISGGDAVISAKTDDGKESQIVVHVEPKPEEKLDPVIKPDDSTVKPEKPQEIQVKEIILNEKNITLYEGDNYSIIAQVLPSNATDKTLSYSSSNKDVVSVDSKGKITALKEGTATISVKNNNVSALCLITVKKIIVVPTSISINNDNNTSLYVNDSINLSAKILPDNVTNKTITWKSSNDSIASIDSSGKLIGIKEGSVVISAITNNGIEDKINVIIRNKPTSKSSTGDDESKIKPLTQSDIIYMKKGSEISISDSSNWSSSNESVADINKTTGKVKAKAYGNSMLLKRDLNGNIVDRKQVTVTSIAVKIEDGKFEILDKCSQFRTKSKECKTIDNVPEIIDDSESDEEDLSYLSSITPNSTKRVTNESGPTRIHFINVGRADATLIEHKGHFGLIDAGYSTKTANNKNFSSSIAYLQRALGNSKLDFVIASHSHSDHIGGMPEIALKYVDNKTKYYYIKYANIVSSKEKAYNTSDKLYSAALSYMKKYIGESNLIRIKNDEDLTIKLGPKGDKMSIRVFGNDKPKNSLQYYYLDEQDSSKNGCVESTGDRSLGCLGTENRNSLAELITYNGKKVLITGDMGEGDTYRIASQRTDIQNVDVYLMGHHGTTTASYGPFIDYIKPKNVVISNKFFSHYYNHNISAACYMQYRFDSKLYFTDLNSKGVIYNFTNGNITKSKFDSGKINAKESANNSSFCSYNQPNGYKTLNLYKRKTETKEKKCYYMEYGIFINDNTNTRKVNSKDILFTNNSLKYRSAGYVDGGC